MRAVARRNDKPTWKLATAALTRFQGAGFDPSVITVLHPDGLECPEDYYEFYRDHGITQISFSIDELEGANKLSGFAGTDFKPAIAAFLVAMLERAYGDNFPLHIRESNGSRRNWRASNCLKTSRSSLGRDRRCRRWQRFDVLARVHGGKCAAYDNFVFGNILAGDFEDFARTLTFQRANSEVAHGVAACRKSCRYFAVCGGGSPVNKLSEKGDMTVTETNLSD